MKQSSNAIRKGFYIIVTAAGIVVIAAAFYAMAWVSMGYEPLWEDMALTFAGLGVLIAPAFFAKAWQKKYELKHKENEKTDSDQDQSGDA